MVEHVSRRAVLTAAATTLAGCASGTEETPTEAVEGSNDFDEHGYGGPDPPDEEHTYRFKLYALDATLGVAESASKRDVGQAMQNSCLAQTQLTGTYAP